MSLCTCPVPAAIADLLTENPCPLRTSQIQKLIFWRKGNTIATEADLILEATWTTLLVAADDTKAIVSPYVANIEDTPGEALESGSGNETKDGIPIYNGLEMTKITGRVNQHPQSIILLMKELSCEDLEVIFVNKYGYFIHDMDTDGTKVKGFDIYNFSIKDLQLGGLLNHDYNDFQFYMPANWSDNLTITDPTANFNALSLWNS